MKVAEVATVTKNSVRLTPPSAAADGVEHAAAETDDGHAAPGRLNSGEPACCAPQNENAHQGKIDGDEGRYHLAVHVGEHRRAENAAGGPRDGNAPDDGPVDIAMPPVRCAGCCRREEFGHMHQGARLRRRSAEAQHDGGGGTPGWTTESAVAQVEAHAPRRAQ